MSTDGQMHSLLYLAGARDDQLNGKILARGNVHTDFPVRTKRHAMLEAHARQHAHAPTALRTLTPNVASNVFRGIARRLHKEAWQS